MSPTVNDPNVRVRERRLRSAFESLGYFLGTVAGADAPALSSVAAYHAAPGGWWDPASPDAVLWPRLRDAAVSWAMSDAGVADDGLLDFAFLGADMAERMANVRTAGWLPSASQARSAVAVAAYWSGKAIMLARLGGDPGADNPAAEVLMVPWWHASGAHYDLADLAARLGVAR